MTKDKDFKKLVRTRMLTTGENFTTARSTLLAEHATRRQSVPSGRQCVPPENEADVDPQIERFRTKILRTFMPDRRIIAIPTKRRALVVVLIEVLAALDSDKVYEEKQLNGILGEFHPDFALLRRELIDYRLLERNSHTGQYWVSPTRPVHTGSQAQEMAGLEVFLR